MDVQHTAYWEPGHHAQEVGGFVCPAEDQGLQGGAP